MTKQPTITCPKCGRIAISTKDQGKSGTLYIHGTIVESGITANDACQVKKSN